MTPDDPRHGTIAGASAHQKDGEPLCAACHKIKIRYTKVRRLAILRGDDLTVAATGTVRRIQALVAMGWCLKSIEREMGVADHTAIGRWLSGETRSIRRENADAVARLYRRLAMTHPPRNTRGERKAATQARNMAARNGWVTALAWDDIDNPDEKPTGVFMGTTRDRQGPSGDSVDHARVERLLAGEWALAAEATRSERAAVLARWPGTLNDLERLTGWRVDRYHLPNGAA